MKNGHGVVAAAHSNPNHHPDIEKFVAKIRRRYEFTASEALLLQDRITELASFTPGEFLIKEGEKIGYSSLILEGFAARCKDTRAGDRQIMELQIPGDFVDLHSYPLEVLDHGICALGHCTIAKLYHDDITLLIEEHPRLARILWFSTMVDASIHREWIMNIGSRSGAARIAHLLCELHCRYEVVGLTKGHSFPFLLNQTQIGECLGFTQVHVNRLLRDLRESKLVSFQDRRAEIHDWDGLCDLADFEPSYLYLDKREA